MQLFVCDYTLNTLAHSGSVHGGIPVPQQIMGPYNRPNFHPPYGAPEYNYLYKFI